MIVVKIFDNIVRDEDRMKQCISIPILSNELHGQILNKRVLKKIVADLEFP